MRLFAVTKATPLNQIGDSTPAFALQTFFPEQMQPSIEKVAERTYSLFNACKLISMMQNCLKKKKVKRAAKKAESRKKALEMLDEEIQKKNAEDTTNDEESVVLKKDSDKKEPAGDRDDNGWVQEDDEPGEDEEFEIQFQGDEDNNWYLLLII